MENLIRLFRGSPASIKKVILLFLVYCVFTIISGIVNTIWGDTDIWVKTLGRLVFAGLIVYGLLNAQKWSWWVASLITFVTSATSTLLLLRMAFSSLPAVPIPQPKFIFLVLSLLFLLAFSAPAFFYLVHKQTRNALKLDEKKTESSNTSAATSDQINTGNNKTKKPKGVIGLIIIFAIGFLAILSYPPNYKTTNEYIALNSVGLEFLFFILLVPAFLLGGLAIYYLFRPKLTGYKICFLTAAWWLLTDGMTSIIQLRNPAAAKAAYIAAHQAHDKPIDIDEINFLFGSTGMTLTMLMTVAIYFLMFYLLRRNKAYFNR